MQRMIRASKDKQRELKATLSQEWHDAIKAALLELRRALPNGVSVGVQYDEHSKGVRVALEMWRLTGDKQFWYEAPFYAADDLYSMADESVKVLANKYKEIAGE